MNNRLQQFFDLEQLTPSRFADIMGIQRSSISHLLSGRNKPGYDFISRFITKFPKVNIEWLINGLGKPYKEIETNITEERNDTLFHSFPLEEIAPSPTQLETIPEPLISKKTIRRVTIFYSDGSFDELYPSK